MSPRNYFLVSGKRFLLFSSCIWPLPPPSPASSGGAAVRKWAAVVLGQVLWLAAQCEHVLKRKKRALNFGWMRLGDMALFQHTTSTSNKKKKRVDSSSVKEMSKVLWERCVSNVRFIQNPQRKTAREGQWRDTSKQSHGMLLQELSTCLQHGLFLK